MEPRWNQIERVVPERLQCRGLYAAFGFFLCCSLLFASAADAAPFCAGQQATIASNEAAIVGTKGHDVIVGGRGPNVISGAGGNDLICGGAGRDTIHGDRGNDTSYGGRNRDDVDGGPGDDDIGGGPGPFDTLIGGLLGRGLLRPGHRSPRRHQDRAVREHRRLLEPDDRR